jgi:hypothetical protein
MWKCDGARIGMSPAFEEALPIIGPQRIGGPFGGHGVSLELGAFLRANDGVGLDHEIHPTPIRGYSMVGTFKLRHYPGRASVDAMSQRHAAAGRGSCLWTQVHARKLPQIFRRQLPFLALGREFNECPM